jgi:hypothetical protein
VNAARRREILVAEVEDLSALIEQDGYLSVGSKGQPVAHPAIALRHAALVEIRHLDASAPPAPASDPLDAFLSAALR